MTQPETWITWAEHALAATEAELAMSLETWEAAYGRHPGPGYTESLRIQAQRLRRDIANCSSPRAAKALVRPH